MLVLLHVCTPKGPSVLCQPRSRRVSAWGSQWQQPRITRRFRLSSGLPSAALTRQLRHSQHEAAVPRRGSALFSPSPFPHQPKLVCVSSGGGCGGGVLQCHRSFCPPPWSLSLLQPGALCVPPSREPGWDLALPGLSPVVPVFRCGPGWNRARVRRGFPGSGRAGAGPGPCLGSTGCGEVSPQRARPAVRAPSGLCPARGPCADAGVSRRLSLIHI